VENLADVIHDGVCIDGQDGKCKRYARGKGDPHHDYYQARATALENALEPVIGWANVLPVVHIVLDELI
jgi:hypothetical protein